MKRLLQFAALTVLLFAASLIASHEAGARGAARRVSHTAAPAPGVSSAQASEPSRLRPVHTYSIVARDARTGELGVAVQSHWFSVGTSVAWAEAGVGAVATQSFIDPSYGKLGLDLMRAGRTAPDALKSLVAGDEARDVRQVAMIDAAGRVDAYTGAKCIDAGATGSAKIFRCRRI